MLDRIESVTLGDVRRLLEMIHVTPVHTVPEWGCDGVHCIGNDIRYAGMWDRMDAVCQQHRHYGKVSPDDLWLEDVFYSLEGLQMS